MLIRRKMDNVATITACQTRRPGISRMTLTLREDRDDKMPQMVRQVEKTTEVVPARELDIDQRFWRKVAIVKFEAEPEQLARLRQVYVFEVLDRQNHELYSVQIAGTSRKIDEFLAAIGRDKVVATARSGFTAQEKWRFGSQDRTGEDPSPTKSLDPIASLDACFAPLPYRWTGPGSLPAGRLRVAPAAGGGIGRENAPPL
jgi:acetolactate synthase-1/3 small subunit